MAAEFVRVRDRNTGHHYTIVVDAITPDHELVASPTDPAVDAHGRPTEPKFNIHQPSRAADDGGNTHAEQEEN